MAYYITYGEFQQHMKDYFFRTGSRMQFPEMADYLYRKGLLSETPPDPILTSEMFGDMDDDAFNKIIDQLPLELNPQIAITPKVKESDIFPNSGDVLSSVTPAIHVPRLTYIIILKLIMLLAEAVPLSLKKANAPCRKESSVSLRRLPNTILSSMMTPPCSALCYGKARLIRHSFLCSHEKTFFLIFSEPFYRMIPMPIISCFFQKIISG